MEEIENKKKPIFRRIIKNILYVLLVTILMVIFKTCVRTSADYKLKHKQIGENYLNAKSEDETNVSNNSFSYGGTDFYLPDVPGMTECYKLPNVRTYLDNVASGDSPVMAYYLNNDTYKHIDNFGNESFDDYFVVFGYSKFENNSANQSSLENSANGFINDIAANEWNDFKNSKNEKSQNLSINFSVGKPTFIESFSLNNNARTGVALTKVKSNNKEYVIISITNILLIKKRLFTASYYKFYDGIESVENAKKKNNSIVTLFFNQN